MNDAEEPGPTGPRPLEEPAEQPLESGPVGQSAAGHIGSTRLSPGQVWVLIGIGLAAGFLAGVFGIGGGVLIVPALVVLLKLDHKQAVGTSLLAILPAAAVSAAAYWLSGSANLVVGAVLALGAVVGAQLGSWVLVRIPRRAAQWTFVGFLVVMITQLLIVVPNREVEFSLDLAKALLLLLLGLIAGTLSAILGVGGGGVVVPVLMVWFGLGDLAAKGASLLMMLPGVVSGLVANLRRGSLRVNAGLLIGASSMVSAPLGVWVARSLSPQVGAWLFAALLVFVGATMAREALRPAPPGVG